MTSPLRHCLRHEWTSVKTSLYGVYTSTHTVAGRTWCRPWVSRTSQSVRLSLPRRAIRGAAGEMRQSAAADRTLGSRRSGTRSGRRNRAPTVDDGEDPGPLFVVR